MSRVRKRIPPTMADAEPAAPVAVEAVPASRGANDTAMAVDEKKPKRHRREGEAPRDDMSLKDRVASDPSKNELKVSSTTETKRFAGALAHIAREQREVTISALSPGNVNTAVKAVAVARNYIKDDGIDVGIVAKFREADRRALEFRYVTFDSRYDVPSEADPKAPTYTVGRTTKSSATAGAVAARVREGVRPVLSCIGAPAVVRALTAISIANQYIERETDRKSELLVVPYFTNETKGEDTVTALNMCVVKIDV